MIDVEVAGAYLRTGKIDRREYEARRRQIEKGSVIY